MKVEIIYHTDPNVIIAQGALDELDGSRTSFVDQYGVRYGATILTAERLEDGKSVRFMLDVPGYAGMPPWP